MEWLREKDWDDNAYGFELRVEPDGTPEEKADTIDASEGCVLEGPIGRLYCDEPPYGSAAFLPTHGNCDQGALKFSENELVFYSF